MLNIRTMKKLKFLENRFIIISLTTIIISFLIFSLNGKIRLPLDSDILDERKIIIEILSSYFSADFSAEIPFQFNQALFNFYLAWSLGALFASLILANPKKSATNSIILVFFICYFLLIFGFRYSPDYFNLIFPQLFIQILFLVIYSSLFSFISAYFFEKIYKKFQKRENHERNREALAKSNRIKCPYCGTEYESIPLYCYNCSKKIESNNKIQ